MSRKKEMKRIGELFKGLRDHMGLNQEAMAKILGTNQPVLSKTENGLRMPDAALVFRAMRLDLEHPARDRVEVFNAWVG